MYTRLNISQEVIRFQHDNFGKKLEMIVDQLIQEAEHLHYNNDRLQESAAHKLLVDTVYKRLGLRIKLYLDEHTLAAIVPLPITDYNILAKSEHRGDLLTDRVRDMLNHFTDQKGTIDLANAKVGGIFSQFEHPLFLDLEWMVVAQFTNAEIVAMLLHELGHAFTYYELSDRLTTTNQVLQALALEVNGTNDPDKKVYILKQLKLDMSNQELDEMAHTSNKVILCFNLVRELAWSVKSLTGTAYDSTSSEQLADSFIARFGYGRYLISGFDKIDRLIEKFGKKAGMGDSTVLAIFCLISAPVLFLIAEPALGVMAIIGGILSAIYHVSIKIYDEIADPSYNTVYGDETDRFRRIRDQSIELLKNSKLPATTIRNALADIKFMDDVIGKMPNENSWARKLLDFIMPSRRKAKKDRELQYLLEELAHNQLFLRSAELKTLEITTPVTSIT